MGMSYPRPIRDIHQLELTSRCNLKCHYCPHHPNLPRPKEDMSWETFEAALSLVDFYCRQGTQTELSLTGIGESLLHPRFAEMVHRARATIGEHRPLVVTTNGLLLDDAMCASIKEAAPRVFISLHRPELAAFAVEAAKRHGILAGINNSFVTSAFDWAGYQKKWTPLVSAPPIKCEYLRQGWGVVLVDGRIATCCLDADASSVVGNVHTPPALLKVQPWGNGETGCSKCHMEVP
jgi:hypothetical protein